MKNKLERRFLPQEFRVSAENEKAKIAGYAVIFETRADMGWWTEEIDSHAFDNVMTTQPDVRALFNHDPNLVLGRTTAGTLRLSVDARGVTYEVDPPDTQVARDLMVSMRRGDVTQSSYAYIVKRDQWIDNSDDTVTRRILEIEELFDVSPVTYPGYPTTSATVRSLPASMPAEMRSRLEKRSAGNCECQCPECEEGNCEACSNEDCDDPECRCEMQSKRSRIVAPPAEGDDAFRERMSLRLRLARTK
jgi:hypothetical protein